MTDQQKVDAIVSDLAKDMKAAVAKIEARPATTKGHYGDYLSIITQFAQGNKQMGGILVLALLAAGANHFGVKSAYKICFGN